jgi:hypothetical protein
MEKKSKYKSAVEWRKADPEAYYAAIRLKCLEEVCEIFGWEVPVTLERKPAGYWTKEKCIESAKECNSVPEWKRKYGRACNKALVNGWLDECCAHMILSKSKGYWTKEKCIETISNYYILNDWRKENYVAYEAARKFGWLNECKKHLKKEKPSE